MGSAGLAGINRFLLRLENVRKNCLPKKSAGPSATCFSDVCFFTLLSLSFIQRLAARPANGYENGDVDG